MKVLCVSCGSIIYLDRNHIKSIGSLVKCSICNFICMVHRPSFAEEPMVEDTNIDQSILSDLYTGKQRFKAELAFEEISEEWNRFLAHGVLSPEEFDGEKVEDLNSNNDNLDHNNLPDLSEYEKMINWGDNTDLRAPSATAR